MKVTIPAQTLSESSHKVQIVKGIRSLTGLSLTAAKRLIDQAVGGTFYNGMATVDVSFDTDADNQEVRDALDGFCQYTTQSIAEFTPDDLRDAFNIVEVYGSRREAIKRLRSTLAALEAAS